MEYRTKTIRFTQLVAVICVVLSSNRFLTLVHTKVPFSSQLSHRIRREIAETEVGNNGGPYCENQDILPFCLPKNYQRHIAPVFWKPNKPSNVSVHHTNTTILAQDSSSCFNILTFSKSNKSLPSKCDALKVSVILLFEDVVDVDDKHQSVKFKMSIEVGWIEPRLQIIDNSSLWIQDHDLRFAKISASWLHYLWVPDFDVLYLKSFQINHVLEPEGSLEIFPDKNIRYTFPVNMEIECPFFHYRYFPLDTQDCFFAIGSYEYTIEEMIFTGEMIYIRQNQRPLHYNIKDISAVTKNGSTFEGGIIEQCDFYHHHGCLVLHKHMYSHYMVRVHMTRLFQPYLIRTYLPSFLIVIISWFGFVIDPLVVPGRMTLLVTLLLTLVNIQ